MEKIFNTYLIMRNKVLFSRLVLLLLFICSAIYSNGQKLKVHSNIKDANTILMTYNIHHGKGMDNKIDYERIAREISFVDADFVALQEVDSCTVRSGEINVAEHIAKLVGKREFLFGPTFNYNGGKFGNAIISKKKPLAHFNFTLPSGEEPRALLVAEFDNCYIASCHLPLDSVSRAEASYEIEKIVNQIVGDEFRADGKKIFSGKDKLFFLLGDLNDLPNSRPLFNLSRNFEWLSKSLMYTFPADKPNRILDYILLYKNKSADKLINKLKRKKLELLTWVQAESVASDHRPVICVFSKDQEVLITKVD